MFFRNQLEEHILSAVLFANERGIEICDADWGGLDEGCLCPLGCIIYMNGKKVFDNEEENAKLAATILGVSEDWINSFIAGFDLIDGRYAILQEGWKIGQVVRKKVKPTKTWEEYL